MPTTDARDITDEVEVMEQEHERSAHHEPSGLTDLSEAATRDISAALEGCWPTCSLSI